MLTTTNLKLKKPEGTDVVNIEDLNYNADVIDSEINKRALKTDIPKVPVTSVAGKTGAVTLTKSDVGLNSVNNWGASSAINNASDTTYATAGAVKKAYDKAVEAFQSASDGKKLIANAITGKGISASNSDTFSQLATKIGQLEKIKKTASGTFVFNSDINQYLLSVRGLPFKPSKIEGYIGFEYKRFSLSSNMLVSYDYSKSGHIAVYSDNYDSRYFVDDGVQNLLIADYALNNINSTTARTAYWTAYE